MSKNYPAFMSATTSLNKILEKIKTAATPERFTQDFLSTSLSFSGGGARAFIPLAKKLKFLSSDGTPTELYKQFRNTNLSISQSAMAQGIKHAYSDIYTRNEYAHKLNKQELEGLVVQMTGLETGHATIRAIVGTFDVLKSYANFESTITNEQTEPLSNIITPESEQDNSEFINPHFGLSYTINLVLPKTDDVSVYDAIFKSLKNNLLRK